MGKTTLLNIISKLIPDVINGDFAGFVKYNNNDLSYDDIDYVFQNSENSLFYNKIIEQLDGLDKTKVQYWLKRFSLENYEQRYLRELSVGQKKIITCIMALLSSRPICLLDEPTANLDDYNKKQLIELIKKAKKNKIIIIVSHDFKIINVCDSIFEIKQGHMQLLAKENKKKYLAKKIISKERKKILLKFNGFVYKFDNGTNFKYNSKIEIAQNSIIGILGKNGSGKTTFANYILKNYRKFFLKGISSKKITCAIMFQTFYKQFFEFNVKRELVFGSNKNVSNPEVNKILNEINLLDKQYEDPRLLSDGQKRVLLICSLLMSKKDVIILDEPFDNVDENTKRILKTMLKEYRELGTTIIILDQSVDEFYDIVDDVIYFNGGTCEEL